MKIRIAGSGADAAPDEPESSRPTARNRFAIRAIAVIAAVMAVTAVVTALITAAVVGDTSSNDEHTGANITGGYYQTATRTTTTTTPTPDTYAVGQPATNGGITLTVDKVSQPPSYQQVSNSMEKTSQYAEFETVSPRAGGKLVRIDATVLNNTRSAIDLTCSWPVNALAVDSSNRNYKPVDELYKVPGTPACNEDLNPGFSSKMVWIFEVPNTADVLAFAFADTETDAHSYSLIRLGAF